MFQTVPSGPFFYLFDGIFRNHGTERNKASGSHRRITLFHPKMSPPGLVRDHGVALAGEWTPLTWTASWRSNPRICTRRIHRYFHKMASLKPSSSTQQTRLPVKQATPLPSRSHSHFWEPSPSQSPLLTDLTVSTLPSQFITILAVASATLASAASIRATTASASTTPHEQYSSSVGVLGCKIDTNRDAYWPMSVSCEDICVKVSYQGRSVNLLRIDQSSGPTTSPTTPTTSLSPARAPRRTPSPAAGWPWTTRRSPPTTPGASSGLATAVFPFRERTA